MFVKIFILLSFLVNFKVVIKFTNIYKILRFLKVSVNCNNKYFVVCLIMNCSHRLTQVHRIDLFIFFFIMLRLTNQSVVGMIYNFVQQKIHINV